MQDQNGLDRARIDGRAAFAGAAFLIGVGLIFLIGRVGAPDGLVRALGPLFALASLALLGLLARSTRVPPFFAADRAVPAPYGGLAFAAIAAGLVSCLGRERDSSLPLAGVAIGLCIGALVVGPLLRKTGASALGDLLVTRFPNRLLNLIFTGLLFAIGMAVATAGFETAVNALVALFAPARGAAVTVVALVLALMIGPGGLAGLIWGATASAGALLIIVYLPIAAQFLTGDPGTWPPLADTTFWSDALTRAWGAGEPRTNYLVVLGIAIAVAALPPFMTPAIASSGEGQALRAGTFGLLFATLIGVGAIIDLTIWPSPQEPMSSGLNSSAMLLAALALAGAGAHTASRARGTNAGEANGPFTPLASQRIARSRALMLGAIGLCAGLTYRLTFEPKLAILIAASLTLGLIAPILALTLSPRATSAHAAAAVLVSLATAVALGALGPHFPNAESLLIGALSAAAAGFAVGWSAAIFSPARRQPPRARRDPFIEPPLEPGE